MSDRAGIVPDDPRRMPTHVGERDLDMRAECFSRKRQASFPGSDNSGGDNKEQPVSNKDQASHTLSMISHDMKSLVGAVISATEMISLELQELSVRSESHGLIKDYTYIIQQAGSDMMLLLNAILHSEGLSDLEDSLTLHKVQDIKVELHKVVTAFSPVAELKGVTINIKLPESLPTVYWDMDKLRLHVINNIVTNALRHTPAGGEVTIEVESSVYGMVSILIADSGAGIAPEHREKVFDKYWQGDNAAHDGMCQRGLGLFNAMLITRAHHGTIRVVDNPHSTGAIFRIDLPCAGAASEPEHAHAPAPVQDTFRPMPLPIGTSSQLYPVRGTGEVLNIV